jgi:hypothetical protein
MADELARLLAKLTTDSWRATSPFSPEVAECHRVMFDKTSTTRDIESCLSGWLQKHQPCLFGRIAAKVGLLSYCILTEEDLKEGDERVRAKIQETRTEWTRQGFQGRKSGFVILVVSPTIARSIPDPNLQALAQRLCSLYLLDDVLPEKVYMDEIFLEMPGQSATTWRWHVGANYFCANGDKRWWQDHRIPGGLGFSMNSVGHMVKSGVLAGKLNELNDILKGNEDPLVTTKVESLGKALEMAMRTIWLAAQTSSGKATRLLPLPEDRNSSSVPQCPVELPDFLKSFDHCRYEGYYHTDITIPTEYFRADVDRPPTQSTYDLDFTYLFNDTIDNPAHSTMGQGRRVRGVPEVTRRVTKRNRGMGESVPIASCARLRDILDSK